MLKKYGLAADDGNVRVRVQAGSGCVDPHVRVEDLAGTAIQSYYQPGSQVGRDTGMPWSSPGHGEYLAGVVFALERGFTLGFQVFAGGDAGDSSRSHALQIVPPAALRERQVDNIVFA